MPSDMERKKLYVHGKCKLENSLTVYSVLVSPESHH